MSAGVDQKASSEGVLWIDLCFLFAWVLMIVGLVFSRFYKSPNLWIVLMVMPGVIASHIPSGWDALYNLGRRAVLRVSHRGTEGTEEVVSS